jgi:CRP-like cAMP-binding protein
MMEDDEERQLARLVAAMEPVRAMPREVLIRAHQPHDYLYVLKAGRVALSEASGAVRDVGVGECFGEEALNVRVVADYQAVAAGSVELFRLHRLAFKLLQMDYGERLRAQLRAAIGHVLSQSAARQLQSKSPMRQLLQQAQARGNVVRGTELNVEQVLGESQTLEALGKGAFGEVHLVVHAPRGGTRCVLRLSTRREPAPCRHSVTGGHARHRGRTHAITPPRHHAITPSRHHAITPSRHHATTPPRHHATTPPRHHATTPPRHHTLRHDAATACE